jgi:proteasome lid subunit RPN8/RPN11
MTWDELPAYKPQACSLVDHFGRAIPDGPDPLAVVSPELLAAIVRHASPTTDEVMGLLFGTALFDASTGRIAPLAATQASRTSVLAGAESWRITWAGLPFGSLEEQIVGWYHSHPGHGIFFSARDRQTHRDCFTQPWQIGLVIDPTTGSFGAFAGSDCRRIRVLIHPGHAGDPATANDTASAVP